VANKTETRNAMTVSQAPFPCSVKVAWKVNLCVQCVSTSSQSAGLDPWRKFGPYRDSIPYIKINTLYGQSVEFIVL